MPDNTQYTRCPECNTAFKVSDKMLSMAKGKVRCGACLVVFQATDYILKAKSKTPIAAVPPKVPVSQTTLKSNSALSVGEETAKVKLEPAQSALDFNEPNNKATTTTLQAANEHELDQDVNTLHDIDIAEETESFEETKSLEEPESYQEAASQEVIDEEELNNEELPAFNISTAITEGSLPRISADGKVINEEFTEVDDSFEAKDFAGENIDSDSFQLETQEEKIRQENLETEDELDPQNNFDDPEDDVSEDDDPENIGPNINIDSDLEDFVLEDFEPSPSDPFDEDIREYIPTEVESLADDEQVIENIPLDDDEIIDGPIDKDNRFIDEMLDIDIIDEKLGDSALFSADELTDHEMPEPSTETSEEPFSTNQDEDFDKLADTLATQINDADTDPDPLDEFEERVEKKKTSLRTAVIIGVILIILALLSVKFWDNRQTLAWDKTWGPITSSVCSVLPCDLKARRDVTKIKLLQRVVEPVENNENRLRIKLLLANKASFEQPFPTISINFSSPQGESIAIKRFSVKDYFPEKQNQLMATDTEVHISFETDLPHPNALGFEFNFE